jgi:hypothetical protein
VRSSKFEADVDLNTQVQARFRASIPRRIGRRAGDITQSRVLERPATGRQIWLYTRQCKDGETRTRTGDTTIFSRVLYQLSYLAERPSMVAANDW